MSMCELRAIITGLLFAVGAAASGAWPANVSALTSVLHYYDTTLAAGFYARMVRNGIEKKVVDGRASRNNSDGAVEWVTASGPGVRASFINPSIRIPSVGFYAAGLYLMIAADANVTASLSVTTWILHSDSSEQALELGPVCTGGVLEGSAYQSEQIASMEVSLIAGVGWYHLLLPGRALRMAQYAPTHFSVSLDCEPAECLVATSSSATNATVYGFSSVDAHWVPSISYAMPGGNITCWEKAAGGHSLMYSITAFTSRSGLCDDANNWRGLGWLINEKGSTAEIQQYISYSPIACRNRLWDNVAFMILTAYGSLTVALVLYLLVAIVRYKLTDEKKIGQLLPFAVALAISLDYSFASLSYLTTDTDVENDWYDPIRDRGQPNTPSFLDSLTGSATFWSMALPFIVPGINAFCMVVLLSSLVNALLLARGELQPIGCNLSELWQLFLRESDPERTSKDFQWTGVLYPWRRLHSWKGSRGQLTGRWKHAAEEALWLLLQLILLPPVIMLYALALSTHLMREAGIGHALDFCLGYNQGGPLDDKLNGVEYKGKMVRKPSISVRGTGIEVAAAHVEWVLDGASLLIKALVLQQAMDSGRPLLFAAGTVTFVSLFVAEATWGLFEDFWRPGHKRLTIWCQSRAGKGNGTASCCAPISVANPASASAIPTTPRRHQGSPLSATSAPPPKEPAQTQRPVLRIATPSAISRESTGEVALPQLPGSESVGSESAGGNPDRRGTGTNASDPQLQINVL